ncbi:MAG: hypothetical protein H0T76_23370 [Nannocystis sp.]|nr:hypothetical protein [Nannocystis sp.]MBA3549426.1 hypothetical protein [Nannocystis sp.]
MRPGLVLLWFSLLLIGGCLDLDLELQADLEGPRVLASSLPRPRNVEVPVLPSIRIELSEAIDPASVRVALVPWEELGRCEFTPLCPQEGSSCERGRCQRDPLSAADIKRVARGEPIEGGVALEVPVVGDSLLGPGTSILVAPRRALQPHARHSLLLFLRDRSGAPLVDEHGASGPWRTDLVTADAGSAGPEARLSTPLPGATEVPPNLARVDIEFTRPVAPTPESRLTLEAMNGPSLELVAPEPCPGWVPGLCLRWRIEGQVLANMSYRPGAGTLLDPFGRAAVPPFFSTSFTTAAAPDSVAPALGDAVLRALGPCVYASFTATEPVQAKLTIGGHGDAAVGGPGRITLALRLDALTHPPGAALAASLEVEDLAGNSAERTLEAVPKDSLAPPLGLTEVLANPRGAEPGQEFVELADLRASGAAMEWSGLRLADLPVDALLQAWTDGEAPGDPLPAFTTRPGERVLVVASGYDPADGADPPPTPGTTLVRVDGSLAAGGLKNAGEPLVLYFQPAAGPPSIVASYGNYITTDAAAHAGRSVVADPVACDLRRAWSSEPTGSASPGAP